MEDRECTGIPRRAIPFPVGPVLLILCLVPAALLRAEIEGEYFFETLADGTPRFTQVLRWEPDPNVLYYELTLQTAAGEEISFSRTEEPAFMMNLSPGEYRYRIVLYNLLRKPEIELPWREFIVLEAEIPRVRSHTPDSWFIEDGPPLVTVSGTDLMPGAVVRLVKNGDPEEAYSGTELERGGTSSVRAKIASDALTAGEYDIVLTNPGGLFSAVEKALFVRHKLPAPSGLVPAGGTVFGPPELRELQALRFSWAAVPEATHYVFRLYRGPSPEPMIVEDLDSVCEWTLGDLSILDRGNFRWTVEAVARIGERVTIPPAEAAEAVFIIDLPQILAPPLQQGDIFYGR